MRVVFRTDASVQIGTGHLMRCLTLARELRKRGAQIEFLCRLHEGHQLDLVKGNDGFAAEGLPLSAGTPRQGDLHHSAWLGSSWEEDAALTSRHLGKGGKAAWLVVDHYALDRRWESALRGSAERIFVIDDLADRAHDCDALLDQNLYPSLETRYDHLAPLACHAMQGPRFALLRDEFRAARPSRPRATSAPRRVLVFFGGADPTNETAKALDALESLGEGGPEADVVVGGANPHHRAIESRCAANGRFTYHFQSRNMAALMASADLAIGAGGTATWERCSVGLPTLCVTIADNQRAVAEAAAERGLIEYLGHHDKIGAGDLAEAMRRAAADPARLATMAGRAVALVDGLGTSRTADFMMGDITRGGLALRRAAVDDAELFHRWANDPDVRRNSFNPAAIPWEGHLAWFKSKLADPSAALFILEREGRPAGQIRFDLEGDTAEIDFSVDPAQRGRGLGRELLLRGMDRFQARAGRSMVFRGTVKQSNPASAKAFLASGFAQEETRKVKGEECLIFSKRAA